MNRIYLFGRVMYKSKLKYAITPKLRLYVEITIETILGERFNCTVYEDVMERIERLDDLNYVYIVGSGTLEEDMLCIVVRDIYSFC